MFDGLFVCCFLMVAFDGGARCLLLDFLKIAGIFLNKKRVMNAIVLICDSFGKEFFSSLSLIEEVNVFYVRFGHVLIEAILRVRVELRSLYTFF